jgi:hypothetical protein
MGGKTDVYYGHLQQDTRSSRCTYEALVIASKGPDTHLRRQTRIFLCLESLRDASFLAPPTIFSRHGRATAASLSLRTRLLMRTAAPSA